MQYNYNFIIVQSERDRYIILYVIDIQFIRIIRVILILLLNTLNSPNMYGKLLKLNFLLRYLFSACHIYEKNIFTIEQIHAHIYDQSKSHCIIKFSGKRKPITNLNLCTYLSLTDIARSATFLYPILKHKDIPFQVLLDQTVSADDKCNKCKNGYQSTR